MYFYLLFSCILQADTDDLFHRWITSLQEAIKRAIKQDTKNETVDNSAKDFGEPSKLHWDDSDTEDNDSKSKQRRRGVKPCAKQILLIPGITISRKKLQFMFLQSVV